MPSVDFVEDAAFTQTRLKEGSSAVVSSLVPTAATPAGKAAAVEDASGSDLACSDTATAADSALVLTRVTRRCCVRLVECKEVSGDLAFTGIPPRKLPADAWQREEARGALVCRIWLDSQSNSEGMCPFASLPVNAWKGRETEETWHLCFRHRDEEERRAELSNAEAMVLRGDSGTEVVWPVPSSR